jgi:hypothetical protein
MPDIEGKPRTPAHRKTRGRRSAGCSRLHAGAHVGVLVPAGRGSPARGRMQVPQRSRYPARSARAYHRRPPRRAGPAQAAGALYVGGMGHRSKNFYTEAIIARGTEAAQRIQELYLAQRKEEAVAAVLDEFVDEGRWSGRSGTPARATERGRTRGSPISPSPRRRPRPWSSGPTARGRARPPDKAGLPCPALSAATPTRRRRGSAEPAERDSTRSRSRARRARG